MVGMKLRLSSYGNGAAIYRRLPDRAQWLIGRFLVFEA